MCCLCARSFKCIISVSSHSCSVRHYVTQQMVHLWLQEAVSLVLAHTVLKELKLAENSNSWVSSNKPWALSAEMGVLCQRRKVPSAHPQPQPHPTHSHSILPVPPRASHLCQVPLRFQSSLRHSIMQGPWLKHVSFFPEQPVVISLLNIFKSSF